MPRWIPTKNAGRRVDFVLLSSLFLSSLLLASGAWAEEPLTLAKNSTQVVFQSGDRVLAKYRYAEVPYKPYVEELCSPSGINILRDSPQDHKHHHGLMFAIKVDGINFWEEHMAPGLQKGVDLSEPKTEKVGDVERGSFLQQIDWINPPEDKVLLKERRSIEVYRGEGLDATLLAWRDVFSLPDGKGTATLTGSNYHGLGMRFLVSMDKEGEFKNADGKTGVDGTNDVKSAWCAYSAKADGHPVTVAMFDHPNNLRYPATWFTMDQGFAYLSDTMFLHREAVELLAGKELDLCYGVAVWDGKVGTEEIGKTYQKWLRIVNAE